MKNIGLWARRKVLRQRRREPCRGYPLVSRPHHRFDLFEAVGETGFCDTADLRKLGETGIGVGKAEVAGFANLGGERGAALFGKKLLHEVGLADGSVNGFLEIRRLAVHLPVHAVPHILHDADALEVHVALGSPYDLEKFGDFIPVFDIDDVVILAVGQAGIQSEALHANRLPTCAKGIPLSSPPILI